MKKINSIIALFALSICFSCNDYLDIVPDNVATIDHAFADKVSAERFLATIYSYMPRIGGPQHDPAILASDEFIVLENAWDEPTFKYYGNRIKQGLQNTNSPLFNYWNGENEGRGLFIALRDCNIFLENIGNVGPDLYETDRNRWIAEVKFFKAFYHYYLMRLYGPIPLIKENLPIASDVNQVKVYRDPFDEGIDYIVQLLDEAIPDLPSDITAIATELGRITKPIAATLKAEVLVMAASPLFNGNPDFSTLVDNRGVKLFNTNEDPAKWNRAATACKEAVEICESANIKLYEFKDARYALSDSTRLLMTIRGTATEKWNQELIWGNPQSHSNTLQQMTIPFFTTEHAAQGYVNPSIGASFRMAELYYSNHGVPIEEDKYYAYSDRYNTTVVKQDHKYYIKPGFTTAILNTDREPRFYANLGFDGNYWFGNGRTKDVDAGSNTETAWLIAAKRGQTSGKLSNIRYSTSGYYTKKTSNFETASGTSSLALTRTTYPIMRLADLYLLYAEALNETLAAPNDSVYKYIDLVRERAGLDGVIDSWAKYSNIPQKPTTKEGMRDIIRQERLIELCFEGKRFWDLRRWKLAHIYFNQPEKGWNVDQTDNSYYNVIVTTQLQYTTKQYLWPIKESELRRNSNLIQNPYWGN